jgi:hypothetical protein
MATIEVKEVPVTVRLEYNLVLTEEEAKIITFALGELSCFNIESEGYSYYVFDKLYTQLNNLTKLY